MKSSQNPISLYIHWPYCLSKCPYCDFFSQASPHIEENTLWPGYQRDIRKWLSERPIKTIFLGGGTPSLMSVRFLDQLFNEILKHTSLSADCEITMEANPDAIDKAKMKEFKLLGVNRLSLGVQSLNEKDLSFLGRRHSVDTAVRRIMEAQSVFDRVNIDLIYALPMQTPASWEYELKQALSFNLSHYSLYQLTIEENTVFGRKNIPSADENNAVNLYRLTDNLMADAGIPAYEVSNYAISGQECRHNMAYWLGYDYIGIGPAAHGRIGLLATQNPRSVSAWLQKGAQTERLTLAQKKIEQLLMGLRLRQNWFPVDGLSLETINHLIDKGLIEQTSKGIRPTLEGTLVLDSVITALIP